MAKEGAKVSISTLLHMAVPALYAIFCCQLSEPKRTADEQTAAESHGINQSVAGMVSKMPGFVTADIDAAINAMIFAAGIWTTCSAS